MKRSALAVAARGCRPPPGRGRAARRRGRVRAGRRPTACGPCSRDGSVVEGDVLVAADGVRSRVRRAIDPAAPEARYVGLTNFGGITRGTRPRRRAHPAGVALRVRPPVVLRCAPPADRRRRVVRQRAPGARSAARSGRRRPRRSGWPGWPSLVADDAGPASALVAAGRLELAGRQHLRPAARAHLVARAHRPRRGCRARPVAEQRPGCGDGARGRRGARPVGGGARHRRACAAYEQARRTRVEAIVKAGARSSSAKIPGRVGRVPLETMLSLLFRSGVAARSTVGFTAHRLGADPTVSPTR